jgi:hypothetical protein
MLLLWIYSALADEFLYCDVSYCNSNGCNSQLPSFAGLVENVNGLRWSGLCGSGSEDYVSAMLSIAYFYLWIIAHLAWFFLV